MRASVVGAHPASVAFSLVIQKQVKTDFDGEAAVDSFRSVLDEIRKIYVPVVVGLNFVIESHSKHLKQACFIQLTVGN